MSQVHSPPGTGMAYQKRLVIKTHLISTKQCSAHTANSGGQEGTPIWSCPSAKCLSWGRDFCSTSLKEAMWQTEQIRGPRNTLSQREYQGCSIRKQRAMSFPKMVQENWISICKKWSVEFYKSLHKNQLKWTKYLNIRAKSSESLKKTKNRISVTLIGQ